MKDFLPVASVGRALLGRGRGGAGGDFLVRGPWKCPVCGRGEWWCRLTRDGVFAWCRNVSVGSVSTTSNVGGEEYIHRLDGACRERAAAVAREAPVGVEAAAPDDLHAMNCHLLGALPPLPSGHRAEMRARRGLSDDDIDVEGYRYLPRDGRVRVVRGLVERFGEGLVARLPGVYRKVDDATGRAWWTLAGAVGLVVPVRTLVDGEPRVVALKVRALGDDVPKELRFTYVSSYRRGGCKAVVAPHCPVRALDLRAAGHRDVALVEGEIAATVVTCLMGRPAVAVAGISNAPRFGPQVACAWPAAVVRIAFDHDPKPETRATVARVSRGLLVALRIAGFDARLLTWPDAFKGLDDLCASRASRPITTP